MKRLVALFLTLVSLTACSGSEQEELQQWMESERARARPQVPPIPEPKRFVPVPYTQEAAAEPFSPQKLTQALKQQSAQSASSTSLIGPELNRRREPLESYPLDTIIMVGSLVKEGKPIALVQVDKLLYQVQPGNYIGQNYGRILKVTETELAVRELVQDSAGEWIERKVTLQLQERSTK